MFETPNLTDTLTLSGDLSGAGPLTKSGAGLLVLSGSNSYGEGTTVDAGTLEALSSAAIPADSSLTVGAGGTFIFNPAAAASAADATTAHEATQLNPVPEPGALTLLAVAGTIAAAAAWRKRRMK